MSSAPVEGADEASTVEGPGSAPLDLIVRLGGALDEARVDYCHWKSNAAIDRSLSADNDLDLLVRRSHLTRFTGVMSELGLARVSRPGLAIPGIESFYGCDHDADRFVHVHAHYQLVVGDDRTKNYRVPIEDAYLRSAKSAGALRIPAPELEYVVFVIRMALKYCTWDEIAWCAMRGHRAGPKPSEREERDYLRARIDEQRVDDVLHDHLPDIDERLFHDCVRALDAEVSAGQRARTARRLERALQPHARHSRSADRALRLSRRVTAVVERRARRGRHARLAGGGALVGIMGGDGAGKSTALSALETWLGSALDVRLVHLGKPRWSLTTYGARATLKAVTHSTDVLGERVPVSSVRRAADVVSAYRPLVWLLCTARDRHRAYRAARRFANDGGIVLCDRYPHPRLHSMEVPLIAYRSGRLDGRLVRAMIRLEQRYHQSIAAPELLVVLRLDPEIAVARKTDESPDSVRARGAEIWNIDWRAAGAREIDASRSPDVVARDLKALVWSTIG